MNAAYLQLFFHFGQFSFHGSSFSFLKLGKRIFICLRIRVKKKQNKELIRIISKNSIKDQPCFGDYPTEYEGIEEYSIVTFSSTFKGHILM